MAAEYLAAIRKVQPRGPYFLGGWSIGGVVAFEMACQLRESGEEVALLALLDSVPSNGDDALADSSEDELLRFFLLDQARLQGRPAPDLEEELAHLPPGERLERLMGRAREAGLLKADVRPEQVRRLLGVYKANLLAFSGYRPRLYPGRVTLFRPDGIPPELRDSPANGWEAFSSQAVDLRAVTGDHYTMLAPPHVQRLAERLRESLEQSGAGSVAT